MADVATSAPAVLPETAAVYWRPRVDAARLRRRGHLWTLTTAAHIVPFVAASAILAIVQPVVASAVAVVSLVHAWIIPALYAQRGANVVRPKPVRPSPATASGPEAVAVGLLGDLVGHEARKLHAQTGLVVERGTLGVWVVGPAGALLVAPGGRRTSCWCVRVAADDLPTADRVSHLLLALRADEAGFATVANLAFSGATRRVRARMPRTRRPAIDAARRAARHA